MGVDENQASTIPLPKQATTFSIYTTKIHSLRYQCKTDKADILTIVLPGSILNCTLLYKPWLFLALLFFCTRLFYHVGFGYLCYSYFLFSPSFDLRKFKTMTGLCFLYRLLFRLDSCCVLCFSFDLWLLGGAACKNVQLCPCIKLCIHTDCLTSHVQALDNYQSPQLGGM